MKVIALQGSPRKNGNTATVLGMVREELEAQGHEMETIRVSIKKINGCLGCFACKKKLDEPGCVQKDDAPAVFEAMMAADAIIYASPLYFWSFSSQLNALVDRHCCIVKGYKTPEHKSFLDGKRTALLVTCASPVENNADIIQEIFDRMQSYTLTSPAGKYIISECTTPDALGDGAREQAKSLARDITGV